MDILYRPRRLRQNDAIRDLVRETELNVHDLIYPIFVMHGMNTQEGIQSMPGIYRYSVDRLMEELEDIVKLGIPGILIFGLPEYKDAVGSEAYADDGVVQEAVKAIKRRFPTLLVITDVCLCEYTDHGHCGIVKDGIVDNDASAELIARTALSHARAGADIVAPSDMMDGRIGAVRKALDQNGYQHVSIMAYSAKYASAFYGPFREAAQSAPQFGDRRSYQMDPANAREALREVKLDIQEGADIVMVKPALSYLDVIHAVRQRFDVPLAAYNVSGEYAMIRAASANGWMDEHNAALEALTSIKRAGADIIITYFAKDAAKWLDTIL
ncbi:porphobilinogen synthase [Mahella australiensis]|uniref:Delta-aminolevulinic acid dehydratase n=1 Tax=Mahella australiensis (strain DSM 15567 / CIP 107919 / 50-1 BON) TaxID=697281 RepID=F3ZW54_MAHA5|nr:porphobilinogen synthase [Mahella australiensis]AEE96434.1 porphobilinogen synthase [Mahella australiensis 50-1 BON]